MAGLSDLPNSPRPTSTTWIVVGVLVIAAAAVGLAAPVNPDFDGTFGLEAYRAHGWLAFGVAAALLLAVLTIGRVATGAERTLSVAVGRVPQRARTPLFVTAFGALCVVLTDTSLSGDGAAVLYQTCLGEVEASSPLGRMLAIAGVRWLPIAPYDVLRLMSCVAGAAYAVVAVWAGRVCFGDSADRAATTVLLVAGGSAAVFFGGIELYALPVLGTLVFLVLSLRQAKGVDARPWPALALGVLATVHGSTLVLIPVLGCAVAWSAGGRPRPRVWLSSAVALAAPILVMGAVLLFGLWGGALPAVGSAAIGSVLGAQGQSPILPLLPSPYDVNLRYAILSPEHLVGVANVLWLTCPVGLLLALAGRRRGPSVTLVALAVVCITGLLLVWNVSYTLRRDWDLFATIGVPLALLGALRCLGDGPVPGRATRVTALCLFAFVPLVLGNAGDRAQRQRYAAGVAEAYQQLPDATGEPGLRARIADDRARWEAAAARLDVGGVVAKGETAWAAVLRGDLVSAESLAEEALAVEPRDRLALLVRGEVLFARGDLGAARAAFEASLLTGREDLRPRARRFLAHIALSEKRRDEAVRQMQRGLREELSWPSEALALLDLLASVHRDAGRFALAEAMDRMAARRRETGLK